MVTLRRLHYIWIEAIKHCVTEEGKYDDFVYKMFLYSVIITAWLSCCGALGLKSAVGPQWPCDHLDKQDIKII